MSKVTKIIPEGATLTRADGSAINVGDDVADGEALTITMRSRGAAWPSGAIVVDGSFSGSVAERLVADVAPVVADVPIPARVMRPIGNAPAVKVE